MPADTPNPADAPDPADTPSLPQVRRPWVFYGSALVAFGLLGGAVIALGLVR